MVSEERASSLGCESLRAWPPPAITRSSAGGSRRTTSSAHGCSTSASFDPRTTGTGAPTRGSVRTIAWPRQFRRVGSATRHPALRNSGRLSTAGSDPRRTRTSPTAHELPADGAVGGIGLGACHDHFPVSPGWRAANSAMIGQPQEIPRRWARRNPSARNISTIASARSPAKRSEQVFPATWNIINTGWFGSPGRQGHKPTPAAGPPCAPTISTPPQDRPA